MKEFSFEYDGDVYTINKSKGGAVYLSCSDGRRAPIASKADAEAAECIRAMLAERAALADVFARLMEDVKATSYYNPERLDSLQAEWERGGR